jgi:hypothetical protein
MGLTNIKKITIKDLQVLLSVSEGTAKNYYRKIKLKYDTPIVTEYHVKDYLKIK